MITDVARSPRSVRVVLTLPRDVVAALQRLAEREERAPKVQAVRLLTEALRAVGELPAESTK